MKKSSSIAFLVALGLVSSLSYADPVTASGDSTGSVSSVSKFDNNEVESACSGRLNREDVFSMGNGEMYRFGKYNDGLCWTDAVRIGLYGDIVMRMTEKSIIPGDAQFKFKNATFLIDAKLAPSVNLDISFFPLGGSDENLKYNQAYVRFMDTEVSPAYAKIGRQALSFGNYSHVKSLASAYKYAIGLGVLPVNGFFASGEVYVPEELIAKGKTSYKGYDAKIGYLGTYNVNDGADLDYRVEASYISDVNDLPGYVSVLPLPILNNGNTHAIANYKEQAVDGFDANSIHLQPKSGYVAYLSARYDNAVSFGFGYSSTMGSSVAGKFQTHDVVLNDHGMQMGISYDFYTSGLRNRVEADFNSMVGQSTINDVKYTAKRSSVEGRYRVWLSSNVGVGFSLEHAYTKKGSYANFDNAKIVAKTFDDSGTFQATLDVEVSA